MEDLRDVLQKAGEELPPNHALIRGLRRGIAIYTNEPGFSCYRRQVQILAQKGKIAVVRGLPEGQDAVSPPTFTDLRTAADFAELAERVREVTGGVPIGFKISAQHIEDDIDFALACTCDYIIIDGRGGGTGAAPTIFRDNISVPSVSARDDPGRAAALSALACCAFRLCLTPLCKPCLFALFRSQRLRARGATLTHWARRARTSLSWRRVGSGCLPTSPRPWRWART